MNKLTGFVLLGALFSAGCSAELGDGAEIADAEDSESLNQAFTESACPTQTPDAFLTTIGPQQYKEVVRNPPYGNSNCTEAFKVDLLAGQAANFIAYAFWDSPLPTTQASCLSATVRSRLYEQVGANWILRQSASSAHYWSNNRCNHLSTGHTVTNTPNRWMFITQAKQTSTNPDTLKKIKVGLYSF